MSPLLTPTTVVRTAEGLNRFGQVDLSEVLAVRVDGEWFPIEEFTGCAGLATVTASSPPTNARAKLPGLKKKKDLTKPKSAVESFLGEDDEEEEEPETTTAAAPASTAAPSIAAPAAMPAHAPSNPATAESCLRITKDVAEALLAGYSMTVRGVLLEPTFAKRTIAPFQAAEAPRAPVNVESTVAGIVQNEVTESVDLQAAQPPPVAVKYVRRFELGRMPGPPGGS